MAVERLVALIDMDCFYCQVEARINPVLKNKPLAVVQYNEWKGGGIIAVNYEARAVGVTRGMRGEDAKQLCPDIELAKVPALRGKADLTKYRDAGREVVNVLCEFSNCVQRASVDEAYIDLSEAVASRIKQGQSRVSPHQLINTFVVGHSSQESNDADKRKEGVEAWLENVYSEELIDPTQVRLAVAAAIVEEMREQVFKKTTFRCSAGIAHNKILAKLVCGMHKPNRQTVLPACSIAQLYQTLPVKKVRNLGGKFGNNVVEQLGCKVMADLMKFSEKDLQERFDEKTGSWLYNIARGIDLEPVTARLISQSIGCCKNFPGRTCLATVKQVNHWLAELAAELSLRLNEDILMVKNPDLPPEMHHNVPFLCAQNKRRAQLITVSAQIGDKRRVSRSGAIFAYDTDKIAATAMALIKKYNTSTDDFQWIPPLKFLGMSVGKFVTDDGNRINQFFKSKPINDCRLQTSKCEENALIEIRPDAKDFSIVQNQESEIVQSNDDGADSETTYDLDSKSSSSTKALNESKPKSFFKKYLKKKGLWPPSLVETSLPCHSSLSDDVFKNQVPSNIASCSRLHSTNREDHYDTDDNSRDIPAHDDSSTDWVSPSELFPDLSNVDEDLVSMLPSPLKQEVLTRMENRSIKNANEVFQPDLSNISVGRNCIQTIANVHCETERSEEATENDKNVNHNHVRFNQSSIDIFDTSSDDDDYKRVVNSPLSQDLPSLVKSHSDNLQDNCDLRQSVLNACGENNELIKENSANQNEMVRYEVTQANNFLDVQCNNSVSATPNHKNDKSKTRMSDREIEASKTIESDGKHGSSLRELCFDCQEYIPLEQFPEHADLHIAIALDRELNTNGSATITKARTNVDPANLSRTLMKKKRGRPCKKDKHAIQDNKTRKIESYFYPR